MKSFARFKGKHLCLQPETLIKRFSGTSVLQEILLQEVQENFAKPFNKISSAEHLWTPAFAFMEKQWQNF